MSAGPLQKAYLKALEAPGGTIEFLFNPKEIAIKKSVRWKVGEQKGVNVPETEFEGGAPRSTTLNLFVDMYEEGKSVYHEFVKKVEEFTKVQTANQGKDKKPRPPFVRFGWGRNVLFKAVITQLDVTYTLFHPDGRPARANVSIGLQEVKEDNPPQNPTSGGERGRRSHTVLPGETLDLISYLELGNAAHWRHLAELNRIDNPFEIRAGQQILIADPE